MHRYHNTQTNHSKLIYFASKKGKTSQQTEKTSPRSPEKICELLENSDLSNIATLYQGGDLNESTLLAVDSLLKNDPKPGTVQKQILDLVANEKLPNLTFTSKYFAAKSIIEILIEDLNSADPNLNQKAIESVSLIRSSTDPLNRKDLHPYIENREKIILASEQQRSDAAKSTRKNVNEALVFAKEMKEANWIPQGQTAKEFDALKEELEAASEMVDELESLYIEFNETDSEEEEASILERVNLLEEALENAEQRIRNDIAPNFFRDLAEFMAIVDASEIAGFDLMKIKKFKIPGGGKIKIINVEALYAGEKPYVIINYEDENGEPQIRTAVNFRKEIIGEKSAYPYFKKLSDLEIALNMRENPLASGDQFQTTRKVRDQKGNTTDQVMSFNIAEINDQEKEGRIQISPDINGENSFNFGEFYNFLKANRFKRVDIEEEDEREEQEEKDLDEEREEIAGAFDDFLGKIDKDEGVRIKPYEDVAGPEATTTLPARVSYLKDLWKNTYFFSPRNVYEFFKHIWEYIERDMKRGDDYRVGKVGEKLFGEKLGEHFKHGKRKGPDGEQFDEKKKFLESQTPEDWKKELREGDDKDKLEICFDLLAERGMLDLWDPKIWKNIFRHNYIRLEVPDEIDPQKPYSRQLYKLFAKTIDSYWDNPGLFQKWQRNHFSNYTSNVRGSFEAAATNCDNFVSSMSIMLKNHVSGSDEVDPHEYEATLIWAIDHDIGSIDEKLYYLIQGVTATHNGETILGFERVSQIQKDLQKAFPFLQFLSSKVSRPPTGKEYIFTKEDFRDWKNTFDAVGTKAFEPSKAVRDTIWNTIITKPEFKEIASEAVRNIGSLDNDTAYFFIPLASENQITTSCSAYGGQKLGLKGYASGFAGYSQYIKTLAGQISQKSRDLSSTTDPVAKEALKDTVDEHKKDLVEAIKAYVRFEGLMTNKWRKSGDRIITLDNNSLNKQPVAGTKHTANHFVGELNESIIEVAQNYGAYGGKLARVMQTIHDSSASVEDRQNALENFGQTLEETIDRDESNTLVKTIINSKLTGIPFSS